MKQIIYEEGDIILVNRKPYRCQYASKSGAAFQLTSFPWEKNYGTISKVNGIVPEVPTEWHISYEKRFFEKTQQNGSYINESDAQFPVIGTYRRFPCDSFKLDVNAFKRYYKEEYRNWINYEHVALNPTSEQLTNEGTWMPEWDSLADDLTGAKIGGTRIRQLGDYLHINLDWAEDTPSNIADIIYRISRQVGNKFPKLYFLTRGENGSLHVALTK